MRTPSRHRGPAGFSLIEVLIAVIVLATGLLALAALQAKLTSNSADAKARSRVASLLTGVIDDERASYSGLASFGVTSCTTTTPTALQTAICAAQTDAGVSGLQLIQTVTPFYGAAGAATFTTNPAGAVADYKQITLRGSWTDAAGSTRTLGLSTIASPLSLSSNPTLLTQTLTTSGSIKPVVHQTNPGSTAGVIPIAIGSNSNAAATNPTPNLNRYTLPSTTFNILTYGQGSNDTSSTSTIQKRVETTVAECVCQSSSSNPISDSFLGRSTFRPTYWNGTKYTSPVDAGVTPYSTRVSSVSQDALCTQCCRDHHDPVTPDSAHPQKFDPVTGDLNRYQVASTTPPIKLKTSNGLVATSTNPPLVASMTGATGSNIYLDSCRFVRVDGLWRVAADLNSEQTGLVATTPNGVGTSSTPNPTSAAAYEDFVIDYLGQKLTSVLNGGAAPVANTVFATHGLNTPTSIATTTVGSDYRFLHGRGLYLDYLEPEALAKLISVNSTCTPANYPTCLLPYLPFNTINVTELATWASTVPSALNVTNASTACKAGAPIRGCVNGKAAATAVDAVITMGHSNSAVASSLALNPYELLAANQQTDAQTFSVTGSNTASEFFTRLAGLLQTSDLSTNDDPSVLWGVGTDSGSCFSSISRTETDPNDYDCVTNVALTVPVSVTLGGYNVVTNETVSNPCSGGTGTWTQPVLTCSTVSSVNVVGVGGSGYNTANTVTGTKTAGETTLITITAKNGGSISPIPKSAARLDVIFSANGSRTAVQNGLGTGYTCDAYTFAPTFTVPTTCN